MGDNKQVNINPISPNSFASLDDGINKSKPATKQKYIGQPTRISVDAHEELAEVIKDYSYYSGMTQKEAIVHILEQYFKENKPKQRPQEVRERADKRIDRRRKKYRV